MNFVTRYRVIKLSVSMPLSASSPNVLCKYISDCIRVSHSFSSSYPYKISEHYVAIAGILASQKQPMNPSLQSVVNNCMIDSF